MITKKICFFLGHYDPARQVIMMYYERIFPKDVELFVVCASEFDNEKYPLKRIKVFEFRDKKSKVPFRLREFCKENKIDILINLTGNAEVALALFIATIFTKTKQIIYFLGDPKLSFKNHFFLFSQFFTARFLACSNVVSKKFKKFLFFSRKKVFYLPFPINVHNFKPKGKRKLRKKLGFKEKDKLIIYVGRVEPAQGSDYLKKLIEQNPDKKFLFIGQLNDENYKNHKFKNLILIPFVRNIQLPDYYNIADLCIFLTKRNSYPYPPRESMACGTPVMVFDIGAFKIINSPATIKIPFDMNELQKEVDKFFKLSKKQREELSKKGRNFVIKDSSEEKLIDKTLKRLLEI